MGLRFSFSNSICTVAIDNAEAGQSFGPTEATELIKLVKSKEFKGCVGLVWETSPTGIFCSGGNLKFYQKQTSRLQGIKTNRQITLALRMLAELNIPTVAAVDGDCFGGGVELLSAFDFAISTPKSFFGLWQRRIGLTFGWGGGTRIEKRLGLKKTIQLSLLAKSFSAFEAASIGLIDEVLPKSMLKERAIKYISHSNKLPQSPFFQIKQWTPKTEQKIFEKLWFNKDHKKVLKNY